MRHLNFGLVGDFQDIEQSDRPNMKAGLWKSLYDVNDPITVQVKDLSDLVASRPYGPIATKLNWDGLTPEGFVRVSFSLISAESGYENPEWLMHSNEPDCGRDLSVTPVVVDPLAGTIRNV